MQTTDLFTFPTELLISICVIVGLSVRLFVSLCVCLQIGVWSSTSGLVVNDNSDVTKATAAEAAFMGSSASDDVNMTRIVTTILVSSLV